MLGPSAVGNARVEVVKNSSESDAKECMMN